MFFKRDTKNGAGYDVAEHQIWIGTQMQNWIYPYRLVEKAAQKEKIRCRIRIGSERKLLHRLAKDEIDLVILLQEPSKGMFDGIRFISILSSELQDIQERSGCRDKKQEVWIVWNGKAKEKTRDQILVMLEGNCSVLRTGYCNY